MASPGCAIGPDGQLLDASEIEWVNDPDDLIPIPPPATATASREPSANLSREPSVTTLDRFFMKTPAARIVAGSRRSARVPRPSGRVTDPNNTMLLATATKRKENPSGSTDTTHIPRRRRQTIESNSDEDSMDQSNVGIVQRPVGIQQSAARVEGSVARGELIDVDSDMEDNTNGDEDSDCGDDAEADYQYTKVLGDADRMVSSVTIIMASYANWSEVHACKDPHRTHRRSSHDLCEGH
jgi:hypothetical protein